MKTNWIKSLNLENTILNDSNIAVLLDTFFINYLLVNNNQNELYIKNKQDGNNIKLIKNNNKYNFKTIKKTPYGKVNSVNKLTYYSKFNEGFISCNRVTTDIDYDNNCKTKTKNRIDLIIEDEDENLINPNYSLRIHTDVVYVDMEDRNRIINYSPDICSGVESLIMPDDSLSLIDYDIISNTKKMCNMYNYQNTSNVMSDAIIIHNEHIKTLPKIIKRNIKRKKIGFI